MIHAVMLKQDFTIVGCGSELFCIGLQCIIILIMH